MGKTILIVEDEPRNLKLLRDLLQRFGYEILEATDGEQGVEKAKEKIPNLILMDIMMPKMDVLRQHGSSRQIPKPNISLS